MNFEPPDRWLQAKPAGPSRTREGPLAAEAARPTSAAAWQRVQGAVLPAQAAGALRAVVARVAPAGAALPHRAVHVALDEAGGLSAPLRIEAGDFTRQALAVAALRFEVYGRRGWLLGHEHAPQDLLDAHDPTAVHVLAHANGKLLGALRLVAQGACGALPWHAHVGPSHRGALQALDPALEVGQLVVAEVPEAGEVLAALVQAAAYLALATDVRYLLSAAPPPYARAMRRFGLRPTGFGGYVPAQRPHVVEVYAGDLVAAWRGSLGAGVWRQLFFGTHRATAALPLGQPLRWPQPLLCGLAATSERVRAALRRVAGDGKLF